MSHIRNIVIFSIFLITIELSQAITSTSDAPGNIFVAGEPIQFAITNAQGTVNYVLKDYFGNHIVSKQTVVKNGTTAIQLTPLNPGWYELKYQDTSTTASVSLGVVLDRKNAPLPRTGKICTDAASAWLIKNDALRKPFAQMVRLAGIPWVRERIAWHQVEKQPNIYSWGHYQTVADTLSAEGINICQIWHDSPAWANDTSTNLPLIADLRDVYRFAKTASAQFANQIQAWEVWNEPDVGFWAGLADRFAGVQKSAYLGIKDGNPNALVLNGALCIGVHPFAHNLFDCGVSDYLDIFNWHDYAAPATYPTQLREYYRLLPEANLKEKPAWLTEAGIPLREVDTTGLLTPDSQKKQCRWVPQSLIMSLVAGVDKTFYFVLPDYLENGNQFGTLHPDLTPYPGFIALSACANILGEAEYLGEYKLNIPGVTAQVFKTKTALILTIWSEKETELSIPTKKNIKKVRMFNIFGSETVLYPKNGQLKVKVGPEIIYLMQNGNWITPDSIRPSSFIHRPLAKAKSPSRIVVVGYSNLPFEKDYGSYNVTPEQSFPYMVEVYNFNQKEETKGTLSLSLPVRWKIDSTKKPIELDIMARQIITFSITPSSSTSGTQKIIARFKPENQLDLVAPSVSYFKYDLGALTPMQKKPLDWGDAEKWLAEASANGSVIIEPSFPETIRIMAQFRGSGDRWAYPILKFAQPIDLSGYDGIAFHLESDIEDINTLVGLMLIEPNGSHYFKQTSLIFGKRRVVFLFKDMRWGNFSPLDNNSQLDLNHISAVKLGLNTPRNEAHFEAGRFELVKY